jgi:hypothetical protein
MGNKVADSEVERMIHRNASRNHPSMPRVIRIFCSMGQIDETDSRLLQRSYSCFGIIGAMIADDDDIQLGIKLRSIRIDERL